MAVRPVRYLSAKTIQANLLGVENEWLNENMTWGNGHLWARDGWEVHYCDVEHPEYGRVVIYGDYQRGTGASMAYFAVTLQFDERIRSHEDYTRAMDVMHGVN